jgi:hypothetical protein
MSHTSQWRGLLLVAAAGLTACVIGCGQTAAPTTPPAPNRGASDPAKPGVTNGGTPKPAVGAAQHKLTADQLYAEHQADAKATAAKYDQVVVELSGKVGRVGSVNEARGQREIWLRLEKGLGGLTCFLKDPKVVGKMALGQTVRVKGVAEANPVTLCVADGKVVELGPDTAARVSAEELAKEFSADWMKAKEKYKERTVVVTGVVADKRKAAIGEWTVELKGDGTTVVACEFPSSEEKTAEKLQAGQKVTLAGAFSDNTGPGRAAMIDTLVVE